MTNVVHVRPGVETYRRIPEKVIDTGKRIEEQLNALGAEGWQVVGVTTQKAAVHRPTAGDHSHARGATHGVAISWVFATGTHGPEYFDWRQRGGER